jgi:hypothetical protein
MRTLPGLLAITLGALATSACSSVLVRAAPTFDAGTFEVSGVETGIGGQIEMIGYTGPNATGPGVGAAIAVAGYSSAGDADPIFLTTLEGRYRRGLRTNPSAQWYGELGTGLGLAWGAGSVDAAAIPVQAEVGLRDPDGGLLWSLGLRERATLLIGSGSPPLDLLNSIQLVAGLGFRLGRPR